MKKRRPYVYNHEGDGWELRDQDRCDSEQELISEALREDREYERMEQREIEREMRIDDLGFPIN